MSGKITIHNEQQRTRTERAHVLLFRWQFGPLPIVFYSLEKEVYYHPQEYDEHGPFDSLKKALKHAELDFGMTDGGFHHTLDDAEKHADWMRKHGYSVE